MKRNDIINVDSNRKFLCVETIETESKDEYAILLNVNNFDDVEIVRLVEIDGEPKLEKVENEYLFNKLHTVFKEKLKETILKEYNIKYIDNDDRK